MGSGACPTARWWYELGRENDLAMPKPGDSLLALLAAVTSPAGIAVDTRRHQLAVTSMQSNTMYLLPLR